jgi:hypothetical protein
MRNEAPEDRVTVLPSESGQATAVAVVEALELTLDDDWDTVDEAEDELLATELELVVETEPLADELDETSSLAPQT